MPQTASELRAAILGLIGDYTAAAFPVKPFVPGVSAVPVSSKVFDADDISHLVDASLDYDQS